MNKIVAIFAALILGAAAVPIASAASTGKPFMRGVINPSDLANRIEVALTKDPKGTHMLDPDFCMTSGSCATPLNYLVMFQESDPKAQLKKVSDLPEFLRGLKVIDGPPGEYWVACLKKVKGKRGTYEPILHCISRRFKVGEKAWIDSNTNRIVLASDCTNPVEREVPPKACREILVPTKPGDTVLRFAILGPAAISNGCIAVRRSGETEFETWWSDECAEVGCNFSENAKFMGQPVQMLGSYIPNPGIHVFRVPASFASEGSLYSVAFCLERGGFKNPGRAPIEPSRPIDGDEPDLYQEKFIAYMEYLEAYASWTERYNAWRDKWIADHSDTINVVPAGYRKNGSGIAEARVYYTKDEVPPGMPMLYFPWGEWSQ